MRSTKALILAVALSLPIAAATAEPAKASASVSLSYFYDSLSHEGDWFVNANYGYVWRPYGVSASWRPYSDGRWVYSDYGWTFVSYSSWGWAPYHYGRWYFDPYYGWVWVPGTEWGPAWVSFYYGPGWIGWAPLPPRVSYTSSIRYDPRAFCFVESRYFLDANVNRRIAPVSYNTRLVRTTRDITRFSRQRNAVVNVGLSVDHVEKATRTRVRRYRVNERTDVGRAVRTQIRGDALEVFRPNVTARATHPPKVKEDRTKRGRDERAVTTERGRSQQIERPAARTETKVQSKSTTKSKVEVQSKSKERKVQPAQKPPTAIRSESRSSARATTTRPTARATYDTSRGSARTTRSSYARVERDPRSSSRSTSKATVVHGREESRAKVTTRSVAPTRDSGAAQKAAALERAKADQAKAAAVAKEKESPKKKSQRSTRKPAHEHKPPRR